MSTLADAQSKVATWQNKVAAAPDNLLFRFSLGQALLHADDPAGALPHLTACVEGRSDWLLAHLLRGQANRATGHPDQARIDYARALELAIAQHHEDPAHTARRALEELEQAD